MAREAETYRGELRNKRRRAGVALGNPQPTLRGWDRATWRAAKRTEARLAEAQALAKAKADALAAEAAANARAAFLAGIAKADAATPVKIRAPRKRPADVVIATTEDARAALDAAAAAPARRKRAAPKKVAAAV